MPHSPLVVYCIRRSNCPLARAVEEVGGNVALRVLRVNSFCTPVDGEGEYSEVWLRASGDSKLIEELASQLRKTPGVYVQIVFSTSFSKLMRILIARRYCEGCNGTRGGMKCCPFMCGPLGSMVKTSVVIPQGVLFEYIVMKKSVLDALKHNGCRVLTIHSIDEYNYMLTEKQETMLLLAYMAGYYRFPRKISLRELAEKLGVSVSTLAEHLRRAESKIVEAFVRHELPHYFVAAMLGNGNPLETIIAKDNRQRPQDQSKHSQNGDKPRLTASTASG